MISYHAIMTGFAVMAGVSIGAWVPLFFDTFRAVFWVCAAIGAAAAFLYVTVSYFLGDQATAETLTDHIAYWLLAFTISSVMFYFTRLVFG